MDRIKKYINEAQGRAKRRKSPWNLILIPFVLVGSGFSYLIQFKALWLIHVFIYPNQAGRLSEFWKEGLSSSAFASSFLLAMPIFFSSLVSGMMMANLLAWCISPARKIFDKESQGVKGTSFSGYMKGLGKAALYLLPICFALGLIGAATLKSLR